MRSYEAFKAEVTNGLADDMGTEEEDLYQVAMKNLNRILPIMETRVGVDDAEMIFLTNTCFLFGATTIMDTEKNGTIAEKFGTDLYIIPASIHKLVITPTSWNRGNLEVTLWEANRTVIEPDIYLSDTLYRYDRATRTVFYKEEFSEERSLYEEEWHKTYADVIVAKQAWEKDVSVEDVIVEDDPEEVEIWF